MELDLRKNGKMTIDQAKEITENEPEVRKEYTNYIGELAKANKISDLKWLLQVTCRNTHLSLIHDRFCRLRLLDRVLKRGDVLAKVFVDSSGFGRVCERAIEKHNSKAEVIVNDSKRLGRFYIFTNLIKSLYVIFNLFLWPKIISGKRIPVGPVIFLDSFLFIDSFDNNGELKDRYYPGLIENLPESEIKKVWYAPNLIGLRTAKQYRSIFKSIKSAPQNFLMKEDWLKLSDYLVALYFTFKLPKSIHILPLWNGIKVDEIVMEEVNIDKGSHALLVSILFHMFFKRLKEHNVKLEIVIDWSENQVLDRSLNLAMKKYYPDIVVKGYQGYVVPDYYACKDPAPYEDYANTVPDEICVIGQAFYKDKKKYCANTKVSTAPAFRFSNIHNPTYLNCTKCPEIFIVLPISLPESKEIVDMCIKLEQVLKGQYSFIIKQHPSYTKERLISALPELLDNSFKFSDKSLYEHLCRCSLLVSSSSSVCLEATVLGIPVAIVGSLSGSVMNPLANLEELPWKICYNEIDIVEFLDSDFPKKKQDIDFYFEPITPDSVKKFLMQSHKISEIENCGLS